MDHAEPTQPPVEKAPPMTPPPAHPKDSGGARFGHRTPRFGQAPETCLTYLSGYALSTSP